MTADELRRLAEKNEKQNLTVREVNALLEHIEEQAATIEFAVESANRKDAKLSIAADLIGELRDVLLKLVPWLDFPRPSKLMAEVHAVLSKVPGGPSPST